MQLSPRIRQNMEQMLEVQLDSLQSQLKSSNDVLRKTAQSAARTISDDLESLRDLSRKSTRDLTDEVAQRRAEIEGLMQELEQQRLNHGKIVTRRTVVLVLSGIALAGLMAAFSAFLGVKVAMLPPPEPPIQLIPEKLMGSRTIRGVGGLGQMIVLPPGVSPARCPIGTGTNRTCLKLE